MTERSDMSDNQRRNFRVPVEMKSFVYPADGSWKGRRSIQTIDLSCGGIAFYSDPGMEIGDLVEVVLPMTTNPLIVQIKILRKEKESWKRTCYAAKFVALEPEEDRMICEAVFGIQRENRLRALHMEEMEE